MYVSLCISVSYMYLHAPSLYLPRPVDDTLSEPGVRVEVTRLPQSQLQSLSQLSRVCSAQTIPSASLDQTSVSDTYKILLLTPPPPMFSHKHFI